MTEVDADSARTDDDGGHVQGQGAEESQARHDVQRGGEPDTDELGNADGAS